MQVIRWLALGLALAWLAAPVAASAQLTPTASGVEVRAGKALLRVDALSDTILRVRIAPEGALSEDASWAVPAEVRARRGNVTPRPDGFATSAVQVRVDPATLALTLSDLKGNVIAADTGRPLTTDGDRFALAKAMPQGEHYFGLGDKTGGFDRRGSSYVNWNTDAWGFGSATDPIYKSIPFFVAAGGKGGAWGLFLDNTWRSWFDFGHRDADVLALGADGGAIDYYLIAGPSVRDVVRGYGALTGRPPLPPLWALGHQQSRYSYMTDAELRDVAGHLRAAAVPTDVLWLDIDYQYRNRPFTVDEGAFPDLKKLAGDLGKDGYKLVTIVDLHVAHTPGEAYLPYASGVSGDHFLENADGSPYVAPVWPGPSVFPDFTRAETRAWWGKLFAPFVDMGIAGIWNDMNEPAIFDTPTKTMPLDTQHRIDGNGFAPRTASHAEVHNVYGMENSRATFEGLRRLAPDTRPFVMTRASYAGGQRYAVTWTGDNSATWDHLKLSVQQLLNLGLSGFAYSAADVGGFTGGPSPELLDRWYQIGAFTPVFRNHSAKGTPRAEPWVDGPEHLAIRRRAVEERYRLMPYIYGLAADNARTGDPVMRPTFYDWPMLLNAPCDQSMAFTLGSALLIAPPPKPESPQQYGICLPAGGWYDYWTGQPVKPETELEGVDQIAVTPRADWLPVYVRAGTILPRQPLVQSTAQVPQGPLEVHVYPGGACAGSLYADDGTSMAYLRGGALRQAIRCTVGSGGDLTLAFDRREGRHRPWWREVAVVVHGWDGAGRVTTGGRPVPSTADAATRTLRFTVPDPAAPVSFTAAHAAP